MNGFSAPRLFACEDCGAAISVSARVCPHCGRPYARAASRSRVLAGVLALFLGGIGAHKFYLNRPGTGLIYLLFCATLIPAIVAFFEALALLFMSDAEFQRRYG